MTGFALGLPDILNGGVAGFKRPDFTQAAFSEDPLRGWAASVSTGAAKKSIAVATSGSIKAIRFVAVALKSFLTRKPP